MPESPQEPPKPRRTLFQRLARGIIRSLQFFVLLVALYLLVVLVGMIPINNGFEPTPNGVEIFVTSTAIHGDLIVPIRNETVDWRDHLPASCFEGDVSGATHLSVGWGNKEFYVGTPTWADLKASTVAKALFWPSDSCMHVAMRDGEKIPAGARRVRISQEQYGRLVEFVKDSFVRDEDGRFAFIEGAAYGRDDAFYEARGSYHCFNTCNCWVGRAMQTAGLRTGWFTPLPKTVFLYLPGNAD